MNRLTEETIKQATIGKMMTSQEVSSYSPQEIREAISGLVAEHKTILAEALVEAGLALYPESEDILAIASLMAMQRQDWGQASNLLRSLIEQQGGIKSLSLKHNSLDEILQTDFFQYTLVDSWKNRPHICSDYCAVRKCSN